MSPRERTGTILLTRADVRELLNVDACIESVERAFAAHARGEIAPPGVLGVHAERGGLHIKAASLVLDRPYIAAKLNANFPENGDRYGLPTIQGIVALFDAACGRLLALIDSAEFTAIRTAAATAVAARYLARRGSSVVTIVGCGEQSRAQLRALCRVLSIRLVMAVDSNAERAEAYAGEMTRELGIAVGATTDRHAAIRASDVCVTCTTARSPIVGPSDVSPGAFIAAVGADNPEKQEIAPALLAANTVVADIVDQCASIGDLHHAIAAGVMAREDVHAELGQIVAGLRPGRRSESEIIIFDSTGTALQDVAAAALVYESARQMQRGTRIDFRGAA